MPETPETSSTGSFLTSPAIGFPAPRRVPPPIISNEVRLSRAARTKSRISSSLETLVIGRSSEARQVRMRQLGAVHMHMALLDAGRQSGKPLAGVEQAAAIKGAFDAVLLVEI